MSQWTHQICDDCWTAREGRRTPVRINIRERTTCCSCGNPTDSGIYIREDPQAMLFHEPHNY